MLEICSNKVSPFLSLDPERPTEEKTKTQRILDKVLFAAGAACTGVPSREKDHPQGLEAGKLVPG